jgi:serine/threonine protein phosphatase PrpC
LLTELSYEKEDNRQRSKTLVQTDNLVVLVLSDRGGRKENQDAWGLRLTDSGELYLALADGLGGLAGGREASRAAVTGVLRALDSVADEGELIPEAFKAAHESVLLARQKDRAKSLMSSTLTLVEVKDGFCRWGHVGDTRLYLNNDQKILFQTLDHTVAQALAAAGEMDPEEIRHDPNRHLLVKSLGNDNPYPKPTLGSSAERGEFDLVILATDGFWEWIEEDRLSSLAFPAVSCSENDYFQVIYNLETELKEKALAREPEYDNYSVIVVIVNKKNK